MGARRDDRRPPVRGEDLVVTLLCTVAGPLLWWFGTIALAGTDEGGGIQLVERIVGSLCAGAGAIIASWWFMAVLGTALAAVGHRWRSARLARIGRGLSPAFLRRVAASVLGVNVLLAPGAWAAEGVPTGIGQSGPVTTARTVTAAAVQTALPDPGWLPAPGMPASVSTPGNAPAGSLTSVRREAPGDSGLPTPTWKPETPPPASPGSTRAARTATVDTTTVTVRHGDCLWDLAAHELGPTATDLEVDRRWRQWHEHNRSIIGAEADLILPGTVLSAPPLD